MKKYLFALAATVACLGPASGALAIDADGVAIDLGLTGAGTGVIATDPYFVEISGTFVPGVQLESGQSLVGFACHAVAAASPDLQPIQAVQFKPTDGCILQSRPPHSTDPWTTIAVAPGRQLAGGASATAVTPTVDSAQFRVCFQAVAHFIDGNDHTSPRGCDRATGTETLAATA